MTGIMGHTRPAAGKRDREGWIAWRRNTARQRLFKAGVRPNDLTVEQLDAEADRWEVEQEAVQARGLREAKAAHVRAAEFLTALRAAGPGDVIGPDSEGRHWEVDEDGATLHEVVVPG